MTDRGRKRRRTVVVDLDEIRSRFRQPETVDVAAWERIRSELRRIVGDSTFEIWLGQLGLRAIDETGSLLLSCPPATRAWVATRFGRLLDQVVSSIERELRFVDDRELQLLDAISPAPHGAEIATPVLTHHPHDQTEAV